LKSDIKLLQAQDILLEELCSLAQDMQFVEDNFRQLQDLKKNEKF
jgi:hypothetical protein